MDRRSWPWKKKSSPTGKGAATASDSTVPSEGDRGGQDSYKKPNYVQISVDSYTHLTGLEDQVKSYEDQVKSYEEQVKALEDEVKELNEKLSAADSEITTKESHVKQHAKVAEDAVAGWEKADLEALNLKNEVESLTALKISAEDRATHLDGALKECMRQIRNLKEEHEQNLHDVILAKTKQCDKIKLEFESKIDILNQQLLRSGAENAAITRSLQERSNMLIKISEEKSQAETDIEVLKSNVESCEREISSYKYELHLLSKEVEIRNEEKNMSVRSADSFNKQYLEGVKKIGKLEAECQRLRSLVRKKLPGPAALAQMKLEVENMGQDYRRSPVKNVECSPEKIIHKYQKENELLAERLFATEEETKMLKEALAKRNSELQASRSICASTVNRLQVLETTTQQKNLSQNPSLTSLSADGNDDEVISCSENANDLQLMDDFVEMEKLAYLTQEKETSAKADIAETTTHTISQEVIAAISQIYDFAVLIGEEAKLVKGTSFDEDGFSVKLEELSVAFNDVVNGKIDLTEFIISLNIVFGKASKLRFSVINYNETDPDCIDKVALPAGENIPCEGSFDSDSPCEGNFVPISEPVRCKCSSEEYEKLQSERDKLVEDLASSESHLKETEQLVTQIKSQLASEQKSNSLAETQLKCMAESYKSLETRAEALQAEISVLQAKIESLDNELSLEKSCHQDALAKCKDYQEQLERSVENCADTNEKTNQEREITAATEKLAECEESILKLGKQLKGLIQGSPAHPNSTLVDDTAAGMERSDNSQFSPEVMMSPKHHSTISPDKHSHSFTRFFSAKPKNNTIGN
jgi:chromosome segregation ATPase